MLATLTLAAALASTPVQTEWIETEAAPIEVMVLGSYHFTGGLPGPTQADEPE